jgi:hypothetical protein
VVLPIVPYQRFERLLHPLRAAFLDQGHRGDRHRGRQGGEPSRAPLNHLGGDRPLVVGPARAGPSARLRRCHRGIDAGPRVAVGALKMRRDPVSVLWAGVHVAGTAGPEAVRCRLPQRCLPGLLLSGIDQAQIAGVHGSLPLSRERFTPRQVPVKRAWSTGIHSVPTLLAPPEHTF